MPRNIFTEILELLAKQFLVSDHQILRHSFFVGLIDMIYRQILPEKVILKFRSLVTVRKLNSKIYSG